MQATETEFVRVGNAWMRLQNRERVWVIDDLDESPVVTMDDYDSDCARCFLGHAHSMEAHHLALNEPA